MPTRFQSRGPRGQILVLTALMMLLVVLSVFLTFSIGHRTREKIKLQAIADASAYSLAVAEARAFNFYAWSNRAIVAHMVSVLSVMSYKSYLDWYEDALVASTEAFRRTSNQLRGCDNAAALRAHRIADMYWLIMPRKNGKVVDANPHLWAVLKEAADNNVVAAVDKGFLFVEGGGAARHYAYPMADVLWRTRVYKTAEDYGTRGSGADRRLHWNCRGFVNCSYADVVGARGSQWLHDQYHSKYDGEWCGLMGQGHADHFEKVQLLRAHQINVERQLQGMMGKTSYKDIDISNLEDELNKLNDTAGETDDEHDDNTFTNVPRTGTAMPLVVASTDRSKTMNTTLPQGIADTVDPRIKYRKSSHDVNIQYYKDAVDDPITGAFAHRDYDDILAGTRYPNWLTERVGGNLDSIGDKNWRDLQRLARGMTGPDTFDLQAWNYGSTKPLTDDGFSALDSMPNKYLPFIYPAWDPELYSPTNAGFFTRIPPVTGKPLADALHSTDHTTRWGDSTSLGTEDHGRIRLTYVSGIGCSATVNIAQGIGRNGIWNRSETSAFSVHEHMFHGEEAHFGGFRDDKSQDYGKGMYRGHMRFKLSGNDAKLWNMPRTFSLMTVSTTPPAPRPWDFDIKLQLPRPVSFTTLNSPGDKKTNNTMAALSGGLVYFHRPEGFGADNTKEPPNLWNPFWRAKLHPVREQDALNGSADHAESAAVLGILGQKALNY